MARLFIIKQKEKKKPKLEKKHFIAIGIFVVFIFASIFFLILNSSIDSGYDEDYTDIGYEATMDEENDDESKDTTKDGEWGWDFLLSEPIIWIFVATMMFITWWVFFKRLCRF